MNRNFQALIIIVIIVGGAFGTYLILNQPKGVSPSISIDGGYIISNSTNSIIVRALEPNLSLNITTTSSTSLTIMNLNPELAVVNNNKELSGSFTGTNYTIQIPANLQVYINVSSRISETYSFIAFGDNKGYVDVLNEIGNASINNMAFAFHLGDYAPNNAPDQFRNVIRHLNNFPIPVYTVIGNHESFGENLVLYHKNFGPTNYAFHINNDVFVVVDSSTGSINQTVLDWMDSVLSNSWRYRIVLTHVPPFDPRPDGDHGLENTTAAHEFMNIVESHNVNLVICGDIHMYNQTVRNGIRYLITGGAGAQLYEPYDKGGFYHYSVISVNSSGVYAQPVELPAPNRAREIIIRGLTKNVTVTFSDLIYMNYIEGFSTYENRFNNWRDPGIYRGVKISDFLALVGGMGENDTVRIYAADGYNMEFCYGNIYPNSTWYQYQGDMILAYSYNGTSVPDWLDGYRIAFLPPDGHYSNDDCKNTSAPGMGYYVSGSAGANWIKTVYIIEVVHH